jgi:hypothetical protein
MEEGAVLMTGARSAGQGDWGQAELDLALREEDCPACVLAVQTERAVLSWLAKVNLRERATEDTLARSGGLCRRHWEGLLARLPADPGAAAARVLRRTLLAARDQLGRGPLPAEPACPVCAAMAHRSRGALLLILDRLGSREGRDAFRLSFGLCQSHLARALALGPASDVTRALLACHRDQVDRLARELETSAESRGRAASLAVAKLAGSTPPGPAHLGPRRVGP